ncbi:putative hamp domain [Cyanobium sp. PCC 7001]|uniref:DUF2721 domain-containing protein n=1 Tax=Cyanobium sp. PCC 7001 TaxID=180281 RepID=UPI0001804EFA|nr:DUF2721 domain-containing protein [Cyanobium sp. PCC 7001]EDY39485.1 putative hamp domain [Cyanobium sp. PCC 7001]
MHAVLAVTAAPVEGLARAIQLSVAPVFLLAGIGGLLVVLTNRLARIVDRSRRLQEQLAEAAISQARLARQELQLQKRRMGLVLKAIELCTVTVLLVALVVVVVFMSAVAAIDLALVVVPLFTAAMLCLMVAVLLFMREVQLAAAQLRRRF